MKNVIMGVILVILALLISVTVYKSKCDRVVENSGPPGGPMGEMTGGEVPSAGTVFEDGSVMGEDGLLYDANGNPIMMPNASPGGMAPPGAAPSTIVVEELDGLYYLYFGVETFAFAIVLVYMLLSKFNKKDFEETFDDKLKFILCGVASVFITGILTYACTFISDILCSNVDTNGGMDPGMMNPGMMNPGMMNPGMTGDQVTTPEANGTGTTPENTMPEQQNPGVSPDTNTPLQGDIPQNNAGSGPGEMPGGNMPPGGSMPPEGAAPPNMP